MRRRAARLICVVFVAAFLLPQSSPARSPGEARRVLIINVFDPLSSPGVAELDHGIIAGLESSPYQIELYSEDLEMTLFPDEAHQKQFREWYTRKYHDRKPDVIIAVGLEPLKSLALSHKESFGDTPIVFCGSTEEMLGQLKLDSDFTGVWEVAQPEKTLIAALQLQPGTKHVAVVGGVGAYDRYLEAIARESFRKYESRFDFLYLTDLDMPALLERLKHLPGDTIVYHTSLMQDASGARFIDATQSVPLIASASKAPVFVVDDVDLGRGTAGGDVLSWASDGRVVGAMVVRVLNGEKPKDIPIVKSANVYMFDWRALQRWGLKESDLPPGSIVLNRQPTMWESYKDTIIGGVSLILLEALAIGGLWWERARRREVETDLVVSNDRLRHALEAGKSVGWEWDIRSRRDQWFGDLQTMFGIAAASYSAHTEDFYSFVHPDDRERVRTAVADAREGRNPYMADFRIVRADGSVRSVTTRGRWYYAKNGDPERMLGMAADVTDRKEAEEARRQKEVELQKTEKLAKVGAWRWDPETDTVTWSEELYRIAGLDPTQPAPSYKEHPKLFSTESWERLNRAVEESLRTGTQYILDLEMTRPDGTARWVIGRGEAIRDDNGRILQLHGMVQDITDRKKAEQELHASEDRLAGIVGSAMDAIIAVDEERRIVLFNAAAEKIFGCTQDEAVGTLVDRFIPERFRSEHGAYMRRFAESGATTRTMGTPAALWAVRSNGQEFPMEASITHLESEGKSLFTVTIRDITERRRAEEAIRESEQRFRLVANTAPVMIWMSGTDKLCNYFNKTWLDFTGRPLEAELGDAWSEGVHPDDTKRCLDVFARAFDRRESFSMQYRLRRHDGEYRWVLDTGVPRSNPDGSFDGYIGSCIDVTERKQAEEALAGIGRRLIAAHEEESSRIARELHDDVSQRIAMLTIDLEEWDEQLPDSAVEFHAHIGRVLQRLLDIAGGIQALSHRLHSSKLEYLGIAAAANGFCKEFSEQQKVEIDFSHTNIPDDVPKEISLCLFRVLQEALRNAVKHSGVRHFAVELRGTEGEIQLTVNDRGVGFDPHVAVNGHGLGLISMRERLHLADGQITIESQPGNGTTIRARVPFSSSGDSAVANPVTASASQNSH